MKDCSILLEEVIDTLIEVGNGTTEEQLHAAVDKLLEFRDECWMKLNKRLNKI